MKICSKPTHIATSNVKQYENDINDITWTTTNLVGNPLDYHAMIPLIRFMKSWNHKVLYLFLEGKVANLAKYFIGLPYVDTDKVNQSTLDSHTYLYKIGVDELQGYLKSMGNQQGQPSKMSTTPTIITVTKNSPNQWSNPTSVNVEQTTAKGSQLIRTTVQEDNGTKSGQSLLKRRARMNPRNIVTGQPVAFNSSQGYVQTNTISTKMTENNHFQDESGPNILTGQCQQQQPGTRVISYPINDRHFTKTHPVTTHILQSPASTV